MSLLLLFGGATGHLGTVAAVLALSAPSATLAASGNVTLQATAATVTLTAPAAVVRQGFNVASANVALTAPVATLSVSGNVNLSVSAAIIALTTGQASLTFDQTQVLFYIDGVVRGFHQDSLTITDALNQQPNTCSFLISEVEPLKDQEVIIALGGLNNRIFAGHITHVDVGFQDSKANGVWSVTCIDYTRLLDRRKVLKRYTAQSATAIVLDILANYTSGFTAANVAVGMDTIAEIDFTMEDVSTALTRVAQLIGASWYVDYNRDVHFFVGSETIDTPDDITDVNYEFVNPGGGEDTTQRRTRVIVEGGGDVASVEVATSENTVPVDNGIWYSASGGVVKSGAQSFPYTGKSTLDEIGSTVAGKALALSAASPSVVASTAGRLSTGAYKYKITAVLPAGESEVGAESSAATITDITAPSAPSPSASATAGNLTVGSYTYKVTFVTAAGESVAGAGASASISQVSAPSSPSASQVSGVSGNLLPGLYSYKVTYKTSAGETTESGTGSASISDVSEPSAPSGSPLSVVGNLTAGNYTYKVTFGTASGETSVGSASSTVTISNVSVPGTPTTTPDTVTGGLLTASGSYYYKITYYTAAGETIGSSAQFVSLSGANNAVVLTSIPTSSDARVIGRRIYRSDNGSASGFRFIVQLSDNLTGAYTDLTADANRGAAEPSSNTSGSGQVTVTIPTSGDSRVTRRYVYRTAVGGGDWKLIATVGDNSTTSFVDNVPDSSRGTIPPSTNTAGSGKMTVTIPTSGDSRVTSRLIYRTAVGGADGYKLIATVANNSSTSFTDNVPDTSRSTPIPTTNTTGMGQMTVTIPTSADGRVTGRRVYRTPVGGGEYRRIATIGNNTATSFTDNMSDASQLLGELAPTISTAGSGQISVASVPLGPSGTTARRVYRTEADGSVFRFLRTINDNVTTSFTDNSADTSLGEIAPIVSGVGALAGDTSLRVADLTKFPSAGWVRVGDQIVRFTGRSAASGEGTLTGIPATGVGAIGAGIAASVSVVNHPHLTGVSGIQFVIKAGDEINVLVTRNDTVAQAALALIENDGGGGIHEHYIQDRRLSITSCEKRGDAELDLFAEAEFIFSFSSKDEKLRSGKSLVVSLAAPANISGTFKIQRVVLTQFGIPGVMPMRRVTASSYLFTLDQLFRQVELGA